VNQRTILVADDDPDILELILFRLERTGHRLISARDGEQALRLALANLPDLALLDVMMPRMDGWEVTRELRRTAATHAMPVILLTARAQDADLARGFSAGADDYIAKPFSPSDLVARIEALLQREGPSVVDTPAEARAARSRLLA
jgi:DNA-binding response OmpR family regulator